MRCGASVVVSLLDLGLSLIADPFRLQPGDGLYKAPAERVRIW